MNDGRKHPAHPPIHEPFNEPIIVFVTVCTNRRQRVFANPASVNVLINAWKKADSRTVGRCVIMPDHAHLFCAPGRFPVEPLKQWVRYWKNLASRTWPNREQQPLWQRDFWDTQLRRSENYDSKWDYVMDNPVREGLITRAEDWLFQGELNFFAMVVMIFGTRRRVSLQVFEARDLAVVSEFIIET